MKKRHFTCTSYIKLRSKYADDKGGFWAIGKEVLIIQSPKNAILSHSSPTVKGFDTKPWHGTFYGVPQGLGLLLWYFWDYFWTILINPQAVKKSYVLHQICVANGIRPKFRRHNWAWEWPLYTSIMTLYTLNYQNLYRNNVFIAADLWLEKLETQCGATPQLNPQVSSFPMLYTTGSQPRLGLGDENWECPESRILSCLSQK